MTGKDDVLANLFSGNESVGVQVFLSGNSTAIKYDDVAVETISSASANETIDYDAYYYYDGGSVSGGPVKAAMTYTFDYE